MIWGPEADFRLILLQGGLAVAAFGLSVIATRLVLSYLRRRQILDLPNERSSHTLPTPRGGGLAVTPVMILFLVGLAWAQHAPMLATLGIGALALLGVSWLDDRYTLPPLPRFLTQILVVGITLALLPADTSIVSSALPVWLDRVLVGLGWVWFINLYNFMDGIDGITGIETLSIGLGLALLSPALATPALVVAAIAGGFLVWNWHPAKVFLGDSGSIPLGFVLGGLLLQLASEGHLAAALILPAYYLADATITLTRRALAGEKIWQPHRKHFYQRAIQGGKRHHHVSLLILVGNLGLMIAAVISTTAPGWGVVAALVVTALMLGVLRSWSNGKQP